MSHRTLVLVLAAALALPATARATPGNDITGSTCGLATTNDASGLIVADIVTQTGVLWAGPVVLADYADDPALVDVDTTALIVDVNPSSTGYLPADVVGIECIVQSNLNLGTGYMASRTVFQSGPWAFLTDGIAYQATGDVYVCTVIHWADQWSQQSLAVDISSSPGVQCPRATRQVEGHTRIYRRTPAAIHSLVTVD